MQKPQLKIIVIVAILLVAGLSVEWFFLNPNKLKNETDGCRGDYQYINPQVACELSERNLLESFDALHSKIKNSINYSLTEKRATDVSVFMRDLTSRRWFGVNENDNYAPASLLKLPLLIAYYKLSEIQPNILAQKYTYQGKTSTPSDIQNIKPESELEKGKEYTIEELLYRMIVYSDNEMVGPLFDFVGSDFINKTFIDLGVYVPTNSGLETDFLSPKIYTAIFRSLYTSTYLRPENSEKILDLLTKTTFKDGLVAGVPENVPVAHKFGEREIKNSEDGSVVRNLYDCGIIYNSEHPYILCIMAKGQNWDDLKAIIKNISNLVYQKMKD